jgi:hypothetical protein
VVVECACGKRATYKRVDIIGLAVTACECDKDAMAGLREELVYQLLDEDTRLTITLALLAPP